MAYHLAPGPRLQLPRLDGPRRKGRARLALSLVGVALCLLSCPRPSALGQPPRRDSPQDAVRSAPGPRAPGQGPTEPSPDTRSVRGRGRRAGQTQQRFVDPLSQHTFSYLDNGTIRIGVDLDGGGAIGFLSDSGSLMNLVNIHDFGRYIEQSYYSGPRPFGNPSTNWPNWPWNACSAGDAFRNPSTIKALSNDGRTLYVRAIPKQWALKNRDSECTVETWISLSGAVARVRHRLVNQRSDQTQYPPSTQELPAAYLISGLHRLLTYSGDDPFTGDGRLTRIDHIAPPWKHFHATENWAALVDERDWGVGLYHPGAYTFQGGQAGRFRSRDPLHNSTNCMEPVRWEIMDHNIVYDYTYYVIVGRLDDIRKQVYARRPDTRPDYRFTNDRQHWAKHVNARDTGLPGEDGLHVLLDRDNAQLWGPEQWWEAKDVPRLYITARYRLSHADTARLFWSTDTSWPADAANFRPNYSDERCIPFPVIADAQYHTYTVDLSSSPAYKGRITSIRFDPARTGESGASMDLRSVSYLHPARAGQEAVGGKPPGRKPARNGGVPVD